MEQGPYDGLATRLAEMNTTAFMSWYHSLKTYGTKKTSEHLQQTLELPEALTDQMARLIRSAKHTDGARFGLVALLLLDDYTFGREVMKRADSGRIEEIDISVFVLLREIGDIRHDIGYIYESNPERRRLLTLPHPKDIKHRFYEMLDLLYETLDSVRISAEMLDLHNGYFTRVKVPLKSDWDGMNTWADVTRNNFYELADDIAYDGDVSTGHRALSGQIRNALCHAMNIRIFTIATMPREL